MEEHHKFSGTRLSDWDLGPLCFSMYMNDLECKVSNTSMVSKFADDTKLVHPIETLKTSKTYNQTSTYSRTVQKTGKCGIMQKNVASCTSA